MKFYKDRFGKWHEEKEFLHMAEIFFSAMEHLPTVSFLKDTDCIKDERFFECPCVIDYISMGMHIEAIKCYREIHGCTLMKARKMVEEIEKDMEEMEND